MFVEDKVLDRRDKQIQEAFDVNNFKQALSLCEKRLKKGEKTDRLETLRAKVLLSFSDPSRQGQARHEIFTLSQRDPPIVDIYALITLEACLYKIDATAAHVDSIWERAVRLRPGDENLQKTWFTRNFECERWKGAQKASMVLQKNFSKSNQYLFWAILANHLAGTAPEASDMDQRIFSGLAYRLLSKAAADVPVEQPLSASRTLKSSEDVRLLLHVYVSQAKFAEALDILDDSRVGIGSRIGKRDWELVRRKIDLLGATSRWDEEWEYCHGLLQNARASVSRNAGDTSSHSFGAMGDDWKVWSGLLRASKNIYTPQNHEATETLVRSYIDTEQGSRNARLALLLFLSQDSVIDGDTQEYLLQACGKYFEDYSSKTACFRDLVPSLDKLNKINRTRFLAEIAIIAQRRQPGLDEPYSAKSSWITSEINSLKLDYYLIISRLANPSSNKVVFSFVINCLRLYKVSMFLAANLPVSDRQPGDDALILAVMALLRVFKQGHTVAAFRCALLLEFLLIRSKHNYDARSILIRLYMSMGTGSLALKHFAHLKIKHSQYATVAWILFTRISTIHPFPVDLRIVPSQEKDACEPEQILRVALGWYRTLRSQLDHAISNQLDHPGHRALLDTLETRRDVGNGFTRYMTLFEWRRIKRFTQSADSEDFQDTLDILSTNVKDDRDQGIFADCELYDQQELDVLLNSGPRPGQPWLSYEAQSAKLLDIFNRRYSSPPPVLDSGLDQSVDTSGKTMEEQEFSRVIKTLELALFVLIAGQASTFTDTDHADYFATCIINIRGFVADQARKVDLMARDVKGKTFSLTSRLGIPDWHYLHSLFMLLQTLQMILSFLERAAAEVHQFRSQKPEAAKLKFSFGCAAPLKNEILDIGTKVREIVQGVRERLKEGRIDELLEAAFTHPGGSEGDAVGEEMQNLLGEAWVEIASADMLASWDDALAGVLRVELR